ncbi:LysR family transcriptional regulator [Leptolyngbya sp. AN02str]|uniref:LysR family transcriptional regulator n=1 Tax=Leptolyngbya sp. AN02str TaxID=3423363 RepID=UPI003D3159AE
MRLEQLQAFLAVAETGSFQKAAQRCSVTQSTISRQIQALESDLEMTLFHRNAQAKLTVAGDRLLPRARKICQEWQAATTELNELRAGKQPELCVAAIHSLCAYHLPPVLQEFCSIYPDVQLRVTALGSDRALKVLKDGLVDLAIVMHNRFMVTSPDMVVETLYDEPIKLLIAAQHPLAHYTQVPWEELARYPQVVFKDGYGMQRIVQEQFARRGTVLKAALELNTPDAFCGVVRQGEMVALLPESSLIDAYNDSTLTIRQVATSDNALGDPPLSRRVVMVTTSDRLEIPPIRKFHDLILQHFAQAAAPLLGQTIEDTPSLAREIGA